MTVLLEKAVEMLLQSVMAGPSIRIPLEQSFDRILAEDIKSGIDFPPFDRSPLDGYAVRLADVKEASQQCPVWLKQIDYTPAGTCTARRLGQGETIRVMTGAPIPGGADAIVRLEDTKVDGVSVRIMNAGQAGRNICSQGEEIRKGEVILLKGSRLREGELSILAMLGISTPLVYETPKVGVLATGSELIPVSSPLDPGKIRNTNSYMLLAKIRMAFCEPILLGEVADDVEAIIEKLHSVPRLPMYITTGGASVGDCDLAEELFHRLQIPILFKRVAIKPGMPVLAGFWNGSLLIALSGNPAASNVSFEVLVRPLLLRMAGLKECARSKIKVKLIGGFNKTTSARRFVWARCFTENGMVFAEPLHHQGNGMVKSSLVANALLDIPAGCPPLVDGAELDALLLLA